MAAIIQNNMSKAHRNRKQRSLLYRYTFSEWPIEEQLRTLQACSAELSVAVHKFGVSANDETFKELCNCIADTKTMIEVQEDNIKGLKGNVETIMQDKLIKLDLKKQEELIKLREGKTETKPVDNKVSLKTYKYHTRLPFLKRIFTR